jgi:hypothetical protein
VPAFSEPAVATPPAKAATKPRTPRTPPSA